MKLNFGIGLLLVLLNLDVAAQERLPVNNAQRANRPASLGQVISWDGVRTEKVSDTETLQYLYFKGASFIGGQNLIPLYTLNIKLASGVTSASFDFTNTRYEKVTDEEMKQIRRIKDFPEDIKPEVKIAYAKKAPYALVSFVPLRKNKTTGTWEKLTEFDFRLTPTQGPVAAPTRSNRSFANSSVLSEGDWYKIAVTEDGIYKLSYGFLAGLGIDMSTLNPQAIRIYGNGGGMLPFQNWEYRHDDLKENAIIVEGEGDGVFNADDYVLFYGQGPHIWEEGGDPFKHVFNLYSDTTYYFITTSPRAGTPSRIATQGSVSGAGTVVTTFDDYDFYERDQSNLIKSGRQWFGEHFNVVTSYDFLFSFPNVDATSQATVKSRYVARTLNGASVFNINVQGQANDSKAIGAVVAGYTQEFAKFATSTMVFNPTSSNFNINVSFDKGNTSAEGWLDYIQVNLRRNLIMAGNQMGFRDLNSVGAGNIAEFRLSGSSSDVRVWDVSDPTNVLEQASTFAQGITSFKQVADSLKQYIAFDGQFYRTPMAVGQVLNQDLHALPYTDMIIVAPEMFMGQAEAVAELHRNEDDLKVIVVSTNQIYNEFSSGAQDITAIKDFTRMFYERAGSDTTKIPRYLLLFGDGSYDLKDRIQGNSNMVPSYHSNNSTLPTASYVSDDYFGLLDQNESDNVNDLIDVGVGRLPVRTVAEANNAVNKIRKYYSTSTLGAWRTWATFIGDDEDGNIHMRDANRLATKVDTSWREFNIDKIFFDAYPQESSAGGERYPQVNEAIGLTVDKGTLVMSYIGHGGELGWAHERVLEVAEVNSWDNADNMPLFVTATCEFSRYDDPQRTSAGEYVFLNPNGGGIALLTTTRLVYSTPNFEIAQAFNDFAYNRLGDGSRPRLGDITRLTKVGGPKNVNSRNFTLLGDPAMKLAYPKYNVVTTQVPDTIKGLSRVTIKGFVADDNGVKIDNFNGLVYPSIFDKSNTIRTLNNDGVGAFEFDLQKNVIFRGRASVVNGEFEFSFVVPKDISLNYGQARISYYADNGVEDAMGYYDDFMIGGRASGVAVDETGPDIQLYMNDESFVFGGITDENPDLFAKVFDENGINTVGTGIGHDIVAVLDANTTNSIVLNEFYESDVDSYQRGSIRYPLSKLSEGKHTLRIKVWDVYNNSGEAYTEFVVANSADLALDHVLNYPNPFTTNTDFYFEHNKPGQELQVRIQVFTVSGRSVKTIDGLYLSDGYRIGPINWNGRDEYGDKIGRGVYVYRVKVTAPSGEVADEFEKLVILQ